MRSFSTWTLGALLVALSTATPHVAAAPTIARGVAKRSAASIMSSERISLVRANMLNISDKSWEIGAAVEALTELEWPSLGVFGGRVPPPSKLNKTNNAEDVIAIAGQVVNAKTPGALPLIDGDGAVGDPASIGNAVLLANWTRTNASDTRFADAAKDQLDFLLNVAPRSAAGAISQRESEVQLWADFVYMAPPFIAYYGALQGGAEGTKLLQLAYDQCRLYRDVLFDADKSLWRHIELGSSSDDHLWGTGNAWAAAGMLRVLETIRKSDLEDQFYDQQLNLTIWIGEILTGAWKYQKENGTLYNYIDEEDSFADTASTALLAASTYRLAMISGVSAYISAADRAFELIDKSVDEDGWLQNTVDPLSFSTPSVSGTHSPEGQSFVLLLQAAYRDYYASLDA